MSSSNTSMALSRADYGRSLRGLLVGLCFANCLSLSHATETTPQDPLATCAIQKLKSGNETYQMPASPFGIAPQPVSFLDNYAHGSDGQWRIPQQVDRTNSNIRLILLAPHRPLLIDLDIQLDGEAFAGAREQLIDKLLDNASVESLVREAIAVPIPAEEVVVKADKPTEDSSEDDSPKEEAAEDKKETDKDESKEDADGKKEESVEEKGDDDEDEKSKEPLVEIRRREARTVAQRLVNYMASSDVKADREEIRWLLAEWTGGPALLTLGTATSWQRAGIAPLWNALDRDRDQVLSQAELAAASERLAQADVDENSIVELEELLVMSDPAIASAHSYPLLIVLDHETDWQELLAALQSAYQPSKSQSNGQTSELVERIAQGDSTLTTTDLQKLLDESADATLRVSLSGKDVDNVALAATTLDAYSGSENVISLIDQGVCLEFSAGELEKADPSEAIATQIAIGAVVDGYPLFRLVDRNGDQRLSPRECRGMMNVLKALDSNQDGQIDTNEKPTAIRVAITRGPNVHTMLAEPTAAKHNITANVASGNNSEPPAAPKDAPSWFADMDRNRDGDVSASEFLGTSKQFQELDLDSDGLIGSQEVTKFESNK